MLGGKVFEFGIALRWYHGPNFPSFLTWSCCFCWAPPPPPPPAPSAKEREREFLTVACSEAPRPRDVELRRAEDDDIGVVTAD